MRVLEDIRTHTQSLRNWGYPQQVKRILVDLFAPTDDALEEETGVRIQSLVSMWFDISIIIIKRVQAHADKLAPVMGAKSVKEAVNIFWQAAQMTESTPEDLIKFLEEKLKPERSGSNF